MGFLTWFVEWVGHSSLYIQIMHDTGFMETRMRLAPVWAQETHDRIVAWILKDEKK